MQIGQLFGLIRGSHTLLAAQKPPLSTLHLVLRLLQAVAVSSRAAGVQQDRVRDAFLVAVSQGSTGILDSQEDAGEREQEGTFLHEMIEVSRRAHALKR